MLGIELDSRGHIGLDIWKNVGRHGWFCTKYPYIYLIPNHPSNKDHDSAKSFPLVARVCNTTITPLIHRDMGRPRGDANVVET